MAKYVHLNALELPEGGGHAAAIQVHLRQTLAGWWAIAVTSWELRCRDIPGEGPSHPFRRVGHEPAMQPMTVA